MANGDLNWITNYISGIAETERLLDAVPGAKA
jgi:hypothetical protein